jgi:hypothetical protein
MWFHDESKMTTAFRGTLPCMLSCLTTDRTHSCPARLLLIRLICLTKLNPVQMMAIVESFLDLQISAQRIMTVVRLLKYLPRQLMPILLESEATNFRDRYRSKVS